jgi:hypothetical protein
MEKITLDRVCKTIYNRNWREIDPAIEKGIPRVRYSFKDFEKDVMADELIASRLTARCKWVALTAKGVIVEDGKNATIDIEMLRETCGKRWSA